GNELLDLIDPRVQSGDAALIKQEELGELGRLLRQMPAREQAAIYLRLYDQLSWAQAAQRLGSSPDAVRMIAARAVQDLREKVYKCKDRGGVNGRLTCHGRKICPLA